jgi:TATA-binding protein-associated factor Taf7
VLSKGGGEHQRDLSAACEEAGGEAKPQEREGDRKKRGQFDSASERREEKVLLSDIIFQIVRTIEIVRQNFTVYEFLKKMIKKVFSYIHKL